MVEAFRNATHSALEVYVVVVMLVLRTIAAQRVFCRTAIVRNFMQYAALNKRIKRAVNRYPVDVGIQHHLQICVRLRSIFLNENTKHRLAGAGKPQIVAAQELFGRVHGSKIRIAN